MRKPRNRQQESVNFYFQKRLVEKYFPCFECSVKRNLLTCTGIIIPSEDCVSYTVQIRYKREGVPKVRVLSPHVKYDHKAHMYKDSTLCLYHPKENPWSGRQNIHETIIPWIAEWIVFYELYNIYGKWLGPETPHGELQSPNRKRKHQNGV